MSLLMARRARHVYAFEPAPHAANELRKHVRSNGFDNITLVPTPVSDSHRPVVFSLTDNAYGPRIVEGPSRWPISTLTTRVTRLDGRPFTLGPVVPGEVHVMAVPPGYGQ